MPKSANTADEYDFVSHDETALSPEVLAKIREWLEPTDYLAESGEFRRHLSSQAPGTGLWICQTEEYRKWHDSPDHGSLWIKGVPGAGKSVTAASIIHHLRVTEECPVLFFFFRNIVAANFTPRALIQDWLAQLLPFSPKLQFALQSRLDSSLAETSDNDLIQLFLDGASSVPRLYCVADALDEMTNDNRPFLDKLNGLATHRPRSLKLLITSRPKQYLQSALRDSSIVHISLQQQLVDADIVSYLNHRFDVAPKSDAQRHLRQQVVDMVAQRSESLFLYAKLTMDQVEASLLSDDLVDVKKLEQSLPVGLEQMYTSVLAKQRGEQGVDLDLQVLVLESVTHSSRPLRLYELASLINCVCPTAKAPQGFKTLVATCCGPLVEILEDETLQVIHHSFTEFLRGDSRTLAEGAVSSDQFPIIDSLKAHKRLAINCLRYLQSGPLLLEGERPVAAAAEAATTFSKPWHQVDYDEEHYKREHLGLKQEKDPFEYREARLSHPFLSYAVENWSYHASKYDVKDDELFTAVIEFLNPHSLAFRRWLVLRWGSTSKSKESLEGFPTALHIAAFSGLSEFALELIQKGASISATDAQNRVPLHWASANGHAKVASLLIQHGSEPNPEDARGLKPIHLGAQKNHSEVVTILLEAGVEPTTIKTKEDHAGRLLGGEKITRGETAIIYATQNGHTETIIAMIPFCDTETLEQLLCESCRFDRSDAVVAILEQSDVSANATFRGGTALYFACGSASVKSVESLIKRGADVGKMSEYTARVLINGPRPRTNIAAAPLHRLVQTWTASNDSESRAILRMLINAKVDLEQVDGSGNTALLLAAGVAEAYRGGSGCISFPALQALLDAGADVKKTHSKGDTALHLVIHSQPDLKAVQLLVEHGSDPNAKGAGGCTPLTYCFRPQNGLPKDESVKYIVEYLLEQGADPNIRDGHGDSVVCQSMNAGPEVFRMLLSRCNDDYVKRQCWFKLASEHNHERFGIYLEILLAEGIDINLRATNGRTLYLCCLSDDNKLRALRAHGSKTDVVDNLGNNSLHILCQSYACMRERLEHIIAEDGVDPLSTNSNGDTLLHQVVSWYNSEPKTAKYVQWILSLGVPVNAVDNEGDTALHLSQEKSSFGSNGVNIVILPQRKSSLNSTIHHRNCVHFVHAINDGKNVDFEIRNKDGLTALHLASMRSSAEVAILIDAGADISTLTSDSQNVLHLSCRARQPNILGQLLDSPGSLDVNQKDSFGRTPLHYACSSGEPESVAILLKHGANVHAIDSEGRTPLHACAQFASEQRLWNLHGHRFPWLRGPPKDPLRPGSWGGERSRDTWYRGTYGKPRPGIRKIHFPGVSRIAKMLLEAHCDAAVFDKYKYSALDLALQTDCVEFVEVFAKDESLFAKATENMEGSLNNTEKAEAVRQYMKAQMVLVLPRSSLPLLRQDQSALNLVQQDPALYLELLTREDAVEIITGGFNANPLDPSHYCLLETLIEHGHLQLLEDLPDLVLHYSSYESIEKKIQKEREDKNNYLNPPYFTALQIACESAGLNMLMLQLLVEKFQVNVNENAANWHGENYSRTAEIIRGQTALHVLASADHWWQLEGLKYLLAHGADVNALDESGETPLHIAASGLKHVNQSLEGFWRHSAVRILLAHGADINALDKRGFAALHKASAAPDIMKELLKNGADTTIGTQSPLFRAIFDQNLQALEILLDHGVSPDSLDEGRHSRNIHYSLTDSRKVYALLCTAFAEQLNHHIPQTVPLLRALIERGANPYVPLNDKEKMIHFLFEWPEYEVIDTLLSEPCVSRIDFNHRDQQGRTVLMAACDWREVLPGYSHLHWDPKALGPPLRILDRKADATLVDNNGKTALHHLLDNPGLPDDVLLQFINRKEVAPTLFVKDKDGFLPFHYALRILRPVVCELLVAKGANILESDPNGLTALHYIATQILTKSRAPRARGRLQIDLAKEYSDQCLALWEKFLAKGGSINAKDNAGNTPLHAYLLSPDKNDYSAPKTDVCHLSLYDKLFPSDGDVDVFAVNDAGETALHVITRREATYHTKKGHDKALFQMMMAKGLDPLKEDAKGRSALDIASACEKDDIVKILGRK